MKTSTEIRTGTVEVNGALLYHEIRGNGPAVLFISGATGDAGHFEATADELADDFTVVTYDRRGNSRSPAPEGWTETSIREQADDAIGLLEALDLTSATVFGTSAGAIILLEAIREQVDAITTAIVHEPPMLTVLPNGQEVGAEIERLAQEGFAKGGPRAAMELFIRLNAGDQNFESFRPEMRERMLANADLFFGIEVEPIVGYAPDAEALKRCSHELVVVAGEDSRGLYYHDAARWVADTVGVPVNEIFGAHVPYFDDPARFADALRPLLRAQS